MNAIPLEVTDDRKTTIDIDGEKYDLIFNTRAAKEVCAKYGSLSEFGEKLQSASEAEGIEMNVWLCTLLINQGIMIYNRRNPDEKRELFTEEDTDLLTVPADWAMATEALYKGMRRDIESEDESSKNVEVG